MTTRKLSRRARRAAGGLAAALLAFLTVVTLSGTAQAYTAWPDVIIIPRSNGNTCLAQDWGSSLPHLDTNVPVCQQGARPVPKGMQWAVTSAAPDTGYSNVKIRNLWSGDCLTAVNDGGTWRAKILGCDSSRNGGQLWALTWSAQQSGWQFYNFGSHACLDSGQGTFLLRQDGCNPANRYQTWWSANVQ
ncbi:hypothetical protein ACF1B0_35400 [Streptomyces anandii]|uniref:hypothetical protein n=1 Tax=Streptomyces anandii TaxID=285454 RepID=UPI0036FC6876